MTIGGAEYRMLRRLADVEDERESSVCSRCGGDLDEITGACVCALDPVVPKAALQNPKHAIVGGMRRMAARRWGTRTPGEIAIARLSMGQRTACVDLAEGRPIGRRVASSLRRRGMVLIDGAAPARLTPIGEEVARIESLRQRDRKPPPRAWQEGE